MAYSFTTCPNCNGSMALADPERGRSSRAMSDIVSAYAASMQSRPTSSKLRFGRPRALSRRVRQSRDA